MQLNKLFSHLRLLDSEEEKLFQKWLASPFLNSNRKLESLFRYLRRSSPIYQGRRLASERISTAIFPGKPYRETRIKQLGGELVKQLYQFWLHLDLQADKAMLDTRLWRLLYKRSLVRPAEKLKANNRAYLFEEVLQADSSNIDRHHFAMQEHLQILHLGKRDQEPMIQEVNNTIDRYYFYEKLKHYCKALIQKKFGSKQYEIILIEQILQAVGEQRYQSYLGLQFYAHAARALKHQSDEDYVVVKKTLFDNISGLDRRELPIMFLVARNYCIQRLNNRKRNFLGELFELYELENEQGMILINGKIPPATYKNIATVALLHKRYTWLEKFLHRHRAAVEENSYLFNLAQLRFSQARYEEVLQLVEQTSFKEVLMNLSAKAWQLKTYFELWEKYQDDYAYEERLEAHLTAFTTFLNRKRARLPGHYLYHLNLAKFVRELIRYSRPYERDEQELMKLLQRVKATDQVAERRWLVEKLSR